jgi:ketosteroid isomerase-like protein
MAIPAETSVLVQTLDSIVAAFNANDALTLTRLVSPAFDYTLEGRSPIAGRYQGHAGMKQFMSAIHGAAEGTLRVRPIAVAIDADTVIMYADVSASRNGCVLLGQNIYVYGFDDGLLRTGRNIPCDQYAWDEFWNG